MNSSYKLRRSGRRINPRVKRLKKLLRFHGLGDSFFTKKRTKKQRKDFFEALSLMEDSQDRQHAYRIWMRGRKLS